MTRDALHGEFAHDGLTLDRFTQGGFVLDGWWVEPDRNRIVLGDRVVHLEPKPMEVLVELARQPGAVVSRDRLIEVVWDGAHVADGAVTLAISKVRRAFDDTARGSRIVETIAKRGYRLVPRIDLGERPEAAASIDDEPRIGSNDRDPDGSGSLRPPPRRRTGSRRVVAALSLLAALAVWGAAGSESVGPWFGSTPNDWRGDQRIDEGDGPSADVVVLRATPMTSRPGLEVHPELSRQGDRVVYLHYPSPGAPGSLHVQDWGNPRSHRVTPADRAGVYAWPSLAPSGDEVVMVRYREERCHVVRVSISDGAEDELVDCGLAPSWGTSWAPDGRRIAFTRHDTPADAPTIQVLDLDRGSVTALSSPPLGSPGDGLPVFSADGRRLAFVRSRSHAASAILVHDLDLGSERVVTEVGDPILGLAWHPDDRSLVFTRSSLGVSELWRVEVDSGRMERWVVPGTTVARPAVAARRMVFESPSIDVQIRRRAPDGEVTRWGRSTAIDRAPRVAPDGRHVAFVSRRSGIDALWVASLDGADPRPVATLPGPVIGMPSWAPDSRRLVAVSVVDGRSAVHVVSLDGAARQISTAGVWNDRMPSFSTDGRRIVVTSDRDGAWNIWSIDIESGATSRRTDRGGSGPIEVDGFLYYTKCHEDGLWRRPVGGASAADVEQRVADRPRRGGVALARIPDSLGGGLRFVDCDRAPVWMRFDPIRRVVEPFGELPSDAIAASVDLAPDGSLFFARIDRMESDLMWVDLGR